MATVLVKSGREKNQVKPLPDKCLKPPHLRIRTRTVCACCARKCELAGKSIKWPGNG